MTGLTNSHQAGLPSPPGLLLPGATAESVIAVLDGSLRCVGWSPEAEALLGHRPDEVLGRAAGVILADATTGAGLPAVRQGRPQELGARTVRHRDGRPLSLSLALSPLSHEIDGPAWLVVAAETARLGQQTVDRAVLAGLYHESPVQLVIYGTDGRVRWINTAIQRQFGLSVEDVAGRFVKDFLQEGQILGDPQGRLLERDGRTLSDIEGIVAHVMRTGEPLIDVLFQSPIDSDPHHEHVWTCSYVRLRDEEGRPIGVCEVGLDTTDRQVARRRLALLSRASGVIGRTLDVRRTAVELAEVAVPQFADAATVDLLEPVLHGQEAPRCEPGGRPLPPLVRIAQRTQGATVGSLESARVRCVTEAGPVSDPATGALLLPLRTRGSVLGVATFVRAKPRDSFDKEDVELAEELASRTAVCLDNARRYTREHATALMLQRDLLPRALPRPTGVEIAHRYLPAAGPAGVGGDWYDVFALSGARVGLVVGDVVGHGTRAAATMGRLRTTVAALAALDLAPEELLARLDDLVAQTGAASPPETGHEDDALGVTCLYAIYDPTSRRCTVARAGHLPPVLVTADGHAELVDLPAGPPLGLGGLPFESADLELPEGAALALFTDGLVESRRAGVDVGIRTLCRTLSRTGDRPLEEVCDSALAELLAGPPEDDAALLLVRVHALPENLVASWDIPREPGEVATARSLARDRMAEWHIDEAASFVAELVVSELVTNAVRYGAAPVRLRLIQERGLIVEVSDGAHTSPHLRRAATEDEGGRGLFLVAQLTRRWGTRYTPAGKTIWTEVSSVPAEALGAAVADTLSY
ncbi:hypothetical protein GCM10010269_72850 [Streptomyces humidus]|uniref:protein-serine/threonine phosphatase n=1 Tax=Streptomyces humidus TaxID=52259 RepID=A0A918LAG4_9ACTN|nr:SpoIIE family protein phosphatase [Streptomyces humidus]GGS23498.1 hypothetical protein GCM10010269_72850 [Streptomyces humidus]